MWSAYELYKTTHGQVLQILGKWACGTVVVNWHLKCGATTFLIVNHKQAENCINKPFQELCFCVGIFPLWSYEAFSFRFQTATKQHWPCSNHLKRSLPLISYKHQINKQHWKQYCINSQSDLSFYKPAANTVPNTFKQKTIVCAEVRT